MLCTLVNIVAQIKLKYIATVLAMEGAIFKY